MKSGYHKMPDGKMMKDEDHKSGYSKGGMAKKKPMGYRHGGLACGADMKPARPIKKSK
tara:strand:- start:476 stop:649 length:174 start_codon:yes stop_codon:yes gene_type:complete